MGERVKISDVVAEAVAGDAVKMWDDGVACEVEILANRIKIMGHEMAAQMIICEAIGARVTIPIEAENRIKGTHPSGTWRVIGEAGSPSTARAAALVEGGADCAACNRLAYWGDDVCVAQCAKKPAPVNITFNGNAKIKASLAVAAVVVRSMAVWQHDRKRAGTIRVNKDGEVEAIEFVPVVVEDQTEHAIDYELIKNIA